MSGVYAPRGADGRFPNLDVLRGIAVCAILPVNIVVMGTVDDREGLLYPSRWNLDRILWCVEQLLFEGPARGLFTLLFGAGMALMLKSAEGDQPQIGAIDAWARRCVVLLGMGVTQFAVFMWPGEILWTYGIAGLFLLAFRPCRPRTLCVAAAVLLLGLSGLRAYDTNKTVQVYASAPAAAAAKAEGRPLSEAQEAALKAVQSAHEALYPNPSHTAEQIEQRTHLRSLIAWSANGWVWRHLSTWSWPGVVECLSFMLIGIALYRTGLLTGAAATKTYVLVAVIGYGFGLSVRVANLAWMARTGFELDPNRLAPAISVLRSFLYEPARLGVTMGHLAIITLLFKSGALGGAKVLRALGRTSLTTYTLQSLLTSLLFYGCGLVGAMSFTRLMATSVAIWVVSGAVALLWLQRFSMGPAEWLIRALSYGRSKIKAS